MRIVRRPAALYVREGDEWCVNASACTSQADAVAIAEQTPAKEDPPTYACAALDCHGRWFALDLDRTLTRGANRASNPVQMFPAKPIS